MAMFKGFSNAFKIPALRKKILITLGLVAVCRLLSQVTTPGVDWGALQQLAATLKENSQFNMFAWFDAFTGGGLLQFSIGTLSIWPYISAQIVIQLLSSVIPTLNKLRKEGESGRQQLAQITRYLTIVICVVQAWGIATVLSSPDQIAHLVGAKCELVRSAGIGFKLMTVLCMTTTSLFIMWVADQITTFGIGNGGSLIIMINITSRLPSALEATWRRYFGANAAGQNASWMEFAVVMLIGFGVIMGTVMLTQGVRKVLIHAARRSVGGGNSYGMQQSFMPLRVNYAGVMPIIFAQPLIQIPGMLLSRLDAHNAFTRALQHFGSELSETSSSTHLIVMAIFILFFAFFWVATQFNAIEIADHLKKDGSYVPGIRPGHATAEYLDAVMTRVTLIGGTGLLIVALMPSLLMRIFNGSPAGRLPWAIASFFGGTSLLIIVGVALDTLRIMESHLLVRKYDGFLRHGTLRGRAGI